MAWTFATRACHLSGGLKLSVLPSGFLKSRTAILALRVRATSTQFAPVLLWLVFAACFKNVRTCTYSIHDRSHVGNTADNHDALPDPLVARREW
jgi:hypothetical protein